MAWSLCDARIAKVNDRIYARYNAVADDSTSDGELIGYHNECVESIAQEDFWKATTVLSITSGESQIDLATEIAAATPAYDLVNVIRVTWAPDTTGYGMYPAASYDEILALRKAYASETSTERRFKYFVNQTMLEIGPVPGASYADALHVYHSYLPAEIECEAEVGDAVFPIVAAHDNVFVYHALAQLFGKDIARGGNPDQAQYYLAKFERAKRRLLAQGRHVVLQSISSRGV